MRSMRVPPGREYLRQLRIAAGLLAVACLTAAVIFVAEVSRRGEVPVMQAEDLLSDLRWGQSLYSYNEAKSSPSGESGAKGERLLKMRLDDAEGKSYLGFGFGGSFHVPKDADLVLHWKRQGSARSMEFHVVDAGPGRPGEVFSTVIPLIGEGWTVSRIPLSALTRNTFQDASRPKDGVLNPDGIQAVELGFPAGTQMELLIRRIAFVWGGGMHPSFLSLPVLVAVGLLLTFRSFSLDTLRAPGQRFATSRLTNRYVLVLATAAIITMQTEVPRRSVSTADVLVLACAVALLLLDEAWLHPLQGGQLWPWRYMVLLTAALLGGSAPSPVQYGLLCAAAVAPTFERPGWHRLAIFALLAPGLVGVMRPFAPLNARLGHLGAAGLVVVMMFVGAQYLRSRERMQITARTLQLYDGIFHHSSEGIYTFDADGTITSVNPGFERLLARSAEQLLGSRLDEHIASEDRALLAEARAADTARASVDLRFVDAEGALHYTMTRIQPVAGGESAAGFQAISTDISERRLLEEELLKANRELQTLSERDDLTNLFNRRCFDRHLRQEFARARRARTPLALILCDIDHFKDYNDTIGHQGGDDLLRAVGMLLAGFARRAGEMAARYGGDEFALILPAVDGESLGFVAERLRAAFETAELPHPSSAVSPFLTLSIGATSVEPLAEFTPEDVIATADRALYQAKERGRNRVVVLVDVQRSDPSPLS
jgi:diguanylate cyclase (GGDEF)-like protein/PAS domain S-box-containing protein